MNKHEISSRDLRDKQSEILNRIAYGGDHYVVTRHGKETAAIISIEEFYAVQKFLERQEELGDIRDADKAKKEAALSGYKSLDQIVEELDLDV